MCKNLCVFCGMNFGGIKYLEIGQSLGQRMVKSSWDLVYGGASLGVMGAVANSVLKEGGKVYGIIPQKLMELEVAHQELTELIVVDTLHERKQKMYDLSDAFVALPGGFGTLDEFFEILTWTKLDYLQSPIFLLNSTGFFDHLIAHFHYIQKEGFISKEDLALVTVVQSVDELFMELSKIKKKRIPA